MLGQLEPASGDAYTHATHYEPVPVEAFEELLARVPEAFVRAAAFVDVGCGMGRALLLAVEHPFKQVVGIELSPALHAIARENLATARGLAVRCRDVRICRGDARCFRFPKGDLVVFLFNPFDHEVLRVVLNRIVGSRRAGDRVTLLYHVPVHRDVVAEYVAETLYDDRAGTVASLRVP
jgi:SAM-dependent methyltransferase